MPLTHIILFLFLAVKINQNRIGDLAFEFKVPQMANSSVITEVYLKH